MAVNINPELVKSSLNKYKGNYPKFYTSLKDLNKIFDSLNSYWTGERYQRTMKAWNNVVPKLNKYLEQLANSSKVLNGVFNNYMNVDSNGKHINDEETRRLSTCSVSNKDEINYDNAKLLGDLQTASSKISEAQGYIREMKDLVNSSAWSGEGAIDQAKSDCKQALAIMDSNLSHLSEEIKDALKETSSAFEKAKNSYK